MNVTSGSKPSASAAALQAASTEKRRLSAVSDSGTCSAKIVVRISLIVASRSSTARRTRSAFSGGSMPAQRALERHAGGEQPLDHQVVQVARDPVAVTQHGQLLPVGRRRAEPQRDRGLAGERLDQRQHVVVEGPRSPARATTSVPRTTSTVPSGT